MEHLTSESTSVHVVPASATPVAQVISLGELHGEPAQQPPAKALPVHGANPLHAVRARLRACVGDVEISVGELLAAKEHQVLVLDRMVDQAVDLLLEGKVVARGQLVALEGHFAVRISELATQLKP